MEISSISHCNHTLSSRISCYDVSLNPAIRHLIALSLTNSSFNYSWNAEGKSLVLLWFLEDLIRIQVGEQSGEDDGREQDKTGTIGHVRKEG